jgi:hypothetical protein
MSTNQQKNNSEEEIDLGSLFVIIGKGFLKVFFMPLSLFYYFSEIILLP